MDCCPASLSPLCFLQSSTAHNNNDSKITDLLHGELFSMWIMASPGIDKFPMCSRKTGPIALAFSTARFMLFHVNSVQTLIFTLCTSDSSSGSESLHYCIFLAWLVQSRISNGNHSFSMQVSVGHRCATTIISRQLPLLLVPPIFIVCFTLFLTSQFHCFHPISIAL